MTPEIAIQIVRDALLMTFWLSAPMLIAGFVAGFLLSLVQILTSIQDSAFSTVPRLAVFLVTAALSMPFNPITTSPGRLPSAVTNQVSTRGPTACTASASCKRATARRWYEP